MNTFANGMLTALVPTFIVILYKFYLQNGYTKTLKQASGFAFLFPFYGLVHYLLMVNVYPRLQFNNTFRFAILGLIAGFIYSLLGRFMYNLPITLWKMKQPNRIHIILPIFWMIIYVLIMQHIE